MWQRCGTFRTQNRTHDSSVVTRRFEFVARDFFVLRVRLSVFYYLAILVQAYVTYSVSLFVLRAVYFIFKSYYARNKSIHDHNTRYNKLHQSRNNSRHGQHSLKFNGTLLWNQLPPKLLDISSPIIFKKEIKKFLTLNPLQMYCVSKCIKSPADSVNLPYVAHLAIQLHYFVVVLQCFLMHVIVL